MPGYLEGCRKRIGDVRVAASRAEFAFIAQQGHVLKGTGGSYGFSEISRLGGELEQAAQRGDEESIHATLEALDLVLSDVGRRFPRVKA